MSFKRCTEGKKENQRHAKCILPGRATSEGCIYYVFIIYAEHVDSTILIWNNKRISQVIWQ